MRTEITQSHHRTRLPVTFIQAEPFHLYTYSDEAADIDRGIRDSIKGIRLSILAMGMGLAKMKAKSLYRDLDCLTMTQYVQRLCDETKMDRTSVFNWLYIGEAYIKYQNDLEQIGFSDSDGPTKLPFLERALETNQKKDVFDNIKNMTVRDFIAFSKSSSEKDVSGAPVVTVRNGFVYVNGKLMVRINNRLDKNVYSYFRKIICIAGKAMEQGEVIWPVRLRNMDEARRYRQASARLITRLRRDS